MIAAIYARKSTEQTGVADEAKSVARQVENARAFAVAKGWSVDDALVFVDGGISGAEFAKRPAACSDQEACGCGRWRAQQNYGISRIEFVVVWAWNVIASLVRGKP
jgi:hypothetical protein